MNKPLKFKTQDQKVWFVSDLHAKHAKDFILNPRKYASAEIAYESMIKSWNDVVGVNDIVFNLGDIVVGAGADSVAVFKELVYRLNGKQYFTWGNHNAGAKTVYKDCIDAQYGRHDYDFEVYPVSFAGKFTFLGHYAEIIVDGQLIVIGHYPIGSWNEMGSKGHESWNIFGHCHHNYPLGHVENTDLRQLDVGWETFGRPVEFNEVRAIMANKGKKLVDHHGRD